MKEGKAKNVSLPHFLYFLLTFFLLRPVPEIRTGKKGRREEGKGKGREGKRVLCLHSYFHPFVFLTMTKGGKKEEGKEGKRWKDIRKEEEREEKKEIGKSLWYFFFYYFTPHHSPLPSFSPFLFLFLLCFLSSGLPFPSVVDITVTEPSVLSSPPTPFTLLYSVRGEGDERQKRKRKNWS